MTVIVPTLRHERRLWNDGLTRVALVVVIAAKQSIGKGRRSADRVARAITRLLSAQQAQEMKAIVRGIAEEPLWNI